MQLPMLIVFQHIDKAYNIYKNFIATFHCRILELIIQSLEPLAPYTKLITCVQ